MLSGARSARPIHHELAAMTTGRRPRRQEAAGQSLVEMSIALPLMLLLVASAFTLWIGLDGSIGLTNAARAGSLTVATQLAANSVMPAAGPGAPYTPAELSAVLPYATAAVNAEEGVTNLYHSAPCSSGQSCVSLSSANVPTGGGAYLPVVTVTVTEMVHPQVPVVNGFTVRAQATGPAAGGSP